jgi:MFS family permease
MSAASTLYNVGGGCDCVTFDGHEKASASMSENSEPPPFGPALEMGMTRKSTLQDPELPPDGGLKAWTQVLVGHLAVMNSWGYLTSYGFFQSYYMTSLNITASDISWIGSVQIFLVFFIGSFSGRAFDAGYYYTIIIAGSFLQVLGCFTTSISTQYWQLFLAQGICQGLGDGLTYCPTVSLVSTYFSKNRAIAMAFTASGAAAGGIIFPLIARQLLPVAGFAWTVRVMGLVILFNSIVIISIARVRIPPRKTGPLVEWGAFKELPYTLLCVGMFLNLWAVYFTYFYVRLPRCAL